MDLKKHAGWHVFFSFTEKPVMKQVAPLAFQPTRGSHAPQAETLEAPWAFARIEEEDDDDDDDLEDDDDETDDLIIDEDDEPGEADLAAAGAEVDDIDADDDDLDLDADDDEDEDDDL